MSNGKPQANRTPVEKQLENSRHIKKSYGLARAQYSGAGTTVSTNSGTRPSASTIGSVSALKTAGDSMMGPIAFSTKLLSISSNAINIGNSTNAYSSYVIVGAPAGTINTINGAAFNGQLLFLEGTATLTHVIGTSGNITTLTGSNMNLTNTNVMTFIFDVTQNKWQMITAGVGGSSWVGSATSDLDMNTYDIIDVDRLKFSTTAGSGSALTSTDTGIEAQFSGGLPFGMRIQIPSTNSATLNIYRGVTEHLNISSLGTLFQTPVFFGSTIGTAMTPSTTNSYDLGTSSVRWRNAYLSGALTITGSILMQSSSDIINAGNVGSSSLTVSGVSLLQGVTTMSGSSTSITSANIFLGDNTTDNVFITGPVQFNEDLSLATCKIKAGNSTEIGYYVTNTTGTVGTLGTIQAPTLTQATLPTDATLDGFFGNVDGAIGFWRDTDNDVNSRGFVRMNGVWYTWFLTNL